MEMETEKKELNQRIGEYAKRSARVLRKQYLTYDQAEYVYGLQRRKILELATEAGAVYRFEQRTLIDRDRFDAYFERFHVPAGKHSSGNGEKEDTDDRQVLGDLPSDR